MGDEDIKKELVFPPIEKGDVEFFDKNGERIEFGKDAVFSIEDINLEINLAPSFSLDKFKELLTGHQ